MEKFIIDGGLVNDVKTVILNGKQEVATAQQIITIMNKLQNLPPYQTPEKQENEL